MNFFEWITKLTHPAKKHGWIETVAVFTGKAEQAAVGKLGHYKDADYLEYQIRYDVNGKERFGWYVFHPVPDPLPEEIKGQELRIRYCRRKPWIFECCL